MLEHIRRCYRHLGQSVGASLWAPTRVQAQACLFVVGVALLCIGMSRSASAQMVTTYNDARVANAVNAILVYIEGSFGALVMVSAGIGAILSSAFGQYRAALGLLVVAVGAFILRSVLSTFFNDERLRA